MRRELNNLVSIILPVFNGEKYLTTSIESCLDQTYKNFELIIVDDCSKDSSLNIAKEFEKKDSRIIVHSNLTNKKLPAALNIGHGLAKGDYLTWTSDDNILQPKFLETLLGKIEKEKADIIYSNYDVLNEKGKLKRIHKAGPTEHILFGNIIGASFLYKKEVFNELKGYDESLFLLEDYDFWLRASTRFKFYHANTNLYQYRLHDKSLTSSIRSNSYIKNEHKEGVLVVFDKIAKELSWNKKTINLIIKIFLNEPVNIFDYLNDRKIIVNDLLKVYSNKANQDTLINGLKSSIRNELITRKENKNIKTLLKILMEEKSVLFLSSFSKKTTFKYIFKSVF